MKTRKNNKQFYGFIGICLASFLGCIDFTIMNTALPNIQINLNADITQLQWLINIFLLALTTFMVIQGRLADIYGRKRFLYIGFFLFGISSLGAGLSANVNWLIFFRFLQGAGIAILYTMPIAIIPSLFTADMRIRMTSIMVGVNGLGLAIGPVIGGLMISILSWRWIFFINLPIILVSYALCRRTVPESKNNHPTNSIDWPGFILLGISLPMFILATVKGPDWGWTSPLILFLYIATLLCWITFYYIEQHSKSPLLQLTLFANREYICGVIANFISAFYYTVVFFILPLYLQNILGKSSDAIGLILLPCTAMVAIFSPIAGKVVDNFGHKITLLFGFLLFMLSAYLQTWFSAHSHLGFIIFSLVLFGIGWAFILGPSIVTALSSLPESMSGIAIGSIGALHNFGGATGLAIGTVLYHHQAQIMLIAENIKNQLPISSWVEEAVANPSAAIHIIIQATQLSFDNAYQLFSNFFIYSYVSLMWLLTIISLVGFVIVFVGLKLKKD